MVANPAEADVKSKNARVFISYSRKDMAFVDRLEAALRARNIEPLIDRTEIYAFEDWWKRIEALIVAADTIVFVLSPNAVASDICAKEVTFAASINKRFAPIVCERVDDKAVPEPLRRLNFIFFTDSEQFDGRVEQLAEALRTDITWIRRHTEFGEQARRWSEAGRPGPRGLLLRPPILDEAERWIGARPREAPEPTEATQAFIAESRRASTRRRNILTGGLAAGLLVALGLAGFAYWQRAVAVQQEKLATQQRDRAQITQSRFLADLASQRVAAGDPSRALLFALEGMPDSAGGIARPYAPEAEFALFRARQRLQEVQQFDGGPARLSRDGSRIVTAYANDNTKGAAVWDASTGKLIARLFGHTDQVLDADLSPDARLAVTASTDRTARIWDVTAGRTLVTLNGHSGLVNSAVFSPDGKRALTASIDGTARLWDAASGAPIIVLNPSIHSITRATFSPDGRRILTRGPDGTVRVWDAGSGKEIVALRGHSQNRQEEGVGDYVFVAEFSPDGSRVLTAPLKSTARVWDAQGRAITTLTGHTSEIVDGKFSPDGRRIVTASWDKTARIWDAASGKSLAVLQGHASNAMRVAFSPDGRRVATASSDATRVWDAQSGNIISRFEGENIDPVQVQFSLDGRRVITSAVGQTRTWEIEDRQPVVTLSEHQGPVQDNAFSPDGRLVVTASADKTARIWEARTGKAITTLSGHEGPVSRAAFSADGQRVVTMSGTDQTARIWDARTGRTLTTLRDVTIAALSPDGKRAVTASSDKKARIWDLQTGKVLRVFEGHDTPSSSAWLNSVTFSPDGRRIASGGYGKIFVWDAETAAVIASFSVDSSALDLSFSPDGRRIACGCYYSANIWDVDTQQLVSVLKHTGVFGADPNSSANFVATARFSPNGTRVATATHNTARIWDANLAKPVAFFGGSASGVWNPAFSPDGRFLIVPTGGSTTAKIWTIFPTAQALVDDAKAAIPRCLTRQQRDEAFLDPEPPAWCIEMAKWPYDSRDWKDWLKYKRSDAAPPLPDTPEWQSWAASRR